MSEDEKIEKRVIHKLHRRLVPLLMLCYCIAYLDRVNVGFAALTMNKDLGFSSTVFGMGAGIFFFGYVLFEVPSNLMLVRFGTRITLARIMVLWGLIAAAMAFIPGETTFYIARFVLGAAEAGFFPGVLFYLSLWFPSAHRGRIVSLFMTAIPISVVIGSPISGLLLASDGVMGLHGWQWLFIIEGLPAAVLGLVVLRVLVDGPAEAPWLLPEERDWLVRRLAGEAAQHANLRQSNLLLVLLDRRVLIFACAYFGLITCTVGISFWLPQIIKELGLSNITTGLVSAVPSIGAIAGMLLLGRMSDRRQERRLHCSSGFLLGAIGLVAAAWTHSPVVQVAAFTLAAFGLQGGQPIFWTMPSAALSGSAAAASLAFINSIGSIAGFIGPTMIGIIRDVSGGFSIGIIAIAAFVLVAALLVFVVGRNLDDRAAEPDAAEGEPRAGPVVSHLHR
ncbi:MFS transporter [Bradyrhizobium sp. CW10]|uniref:MFS transporter n=1 Tax=Bradyrhizobium sp. CW10 TaxID=2782683 RepID=UPI001FF7DA7E